MPSTFACSNVQGRPRGLTSHGLTRQAVLGDIFAAENIRPRSKAYSTGIGTEPFIVSQLDAWQTSERRKFWALAVLIATPEQEAVSAVDS